MIILVLLITTTALEVPAIAAFHVVSTLLSVKILRICDLVFLILWMTDKKYLAESSVNLALVMISKVPGVYGGSSKSNHSTTVMYFL